MNRFKNIVFTFIAIVLIQFVALAQDPGDFEEIDSPVDAPIDTYIWFLLVLGLGFVCYKYKILFN
jgi:hypothetical protein